jgi:hypothetical protein
VKAMIGGITGWLDEGFTLAAETEANAQTPSPALPINPPASQPTHE